MCPLHHLHSVMLIRFKSGKAIRGSPSSPTGEVPKSTDTAMSYLALLSVCGNVSFIFFSCVFSVI